MASKKNNNVGPMLDPKKITPMVASSFIVDLPEIDPHVVRSIDSTPECTNQEVHLQLYDSIEPNTRDMINLLITKMSNSSNKFNWFSSNPHTNTNLTVKHVDGSGNVLAQTVYEGLSIPKIHISACDYSATDFSIITLVFKFKTLRIS